MSLNGKVDKIDPEESHELDGKYNVDSVNMWQLKLASLVSIPDHFWSNGRPSSGKTHWPVFQHQGTGIE